MKTIIPDKDTDLLDALKCGNHDAFEKLFNRYAQKLFSFSLSYLKNEDEAEEIVQDVFFKIWINRQSLKSDTSFKSYLFTIAFNAIRKFFNRKAKSDQFLLDLTDVLDTDQDTVDYEHNYQKVIGKLEQFIEEMPEKRREIFIQKKKMGKPVKQIAKEAGVSEKTIENQITEAMKYLKRRFEDELPGGMLFFALFVELNGN